MSAPATTSIFISYAHKDGADLARRLHDDLSASGYDVWFDRSRLTAGANWSGEIEEAVDRSNVVLAMLSPGSFKSDICRGEQLRALRIGKRVIPLMLFNESDRPVFLEARQFISFVPSKPYPEALQELIAAIAGAETATLSTRYLQTYVTAPRLPPNVVTRPDALRSLREMVLNEEWPTTTIGVAAIIGMSGAGKTTLVQMLCHDRAVLDAFPDGVIWAGLGQEITDLLPKIREIGKALGDESKHYDTEEGASNRLRTILRSKTAIIVLDDVWKLAHVEPFLADAPISRLLITTRKQDIPVSLGAKRVDVGLLSEAQSLEVLSRWTAVPPSDLPTEAPDIVRQCGRLPLALSMTGGLIRNSVLKGRTDAWAAALYRLEEAQLDQIRFPLEHYPYPELQRAIQVSVEALEPPARSRYYTFCVFQEDVPVPERVFETFWQADYYDVQQTVDAWLDASLALRDDRGRIRLHDLQLDYVRKLAGDEVLALHQQLVDGYGKACKRRWSAGPNDGYFFERLAWHMAGAGNWRDLAALLLDPAFIRAKMDALSYVELQDDFQWLQECVAVLQDAGEQQLLDELGAVVNDLPWFVAREAETAFIEEWLRRDDSQGLVIVGVGGSGKSSLLRHMWVRHFRSAVLIDDVGFDLESLRVHLIHKMLPLLPPVIRTRVLEVGTWKYLVSVAHELRCPAGEKICVLITGLEGYLYKGHEELLLSLVRDLSAGNMRFIFSSRVDWPGERLSEPICDVQVLRLDALSNEGAARMLEHLMRDWQEKSDPWLIEELIARSEGSPLTLRLMVQVLKEGISFEELREAMDAEFIQRSLLQRVHRRLLGEGVPDKLLRAIARRLTYEDMDLNTLQRELNVPSSVITTLEESGLFLVVTDGKRSLLRLSHPQVLDFLQAQYEDGDSSIK